MGSGVEMERVIAILEDSGLSFERGPYVNLWTESEQAVYRDPAHRSNYARDEAVQAHRITELAKRIVGLE